jgi:hypothetical protein
VNDSERLGARDDAAMSKAPADAEHDHVTGPWRGYDLGPAQQELQITLVVAVQHPVAGVRPWIKGFDEAEVAVDAHQNHRTVDADTLDVGGMVVRRANPRARGGDNIGATLSFVHRQTAISTGGTNGKPRKFDRLLNRP